MRNVGFTLANGVVLGVTLLVSSAIVVIAACYEMRSVECMPASTATNSHPYCGEATVENTAGYADQCDETLPWSVFGSSGSYLPPGEQTPCAGTYTAYYDPDGPCGTITGSYTGMVWRVACNPDVIICP
jgi:hypothetical protein